MNMLRTLYRYTIFCFCCFPATLFSQTEQLYTPNQVAAANPACGTTNVPVYGFAFNSTGFTNPVFTGLTGFTTSGTYVAGDITSFNLYQTNFSVFNTSNLLATISTGLGPGTHNFPAFSYTVSPSPVARYLWITVDIAVGAGNGNTIIVDPLTIAMTTITGTETAATITAGGTQTITCSALSVELTSFTGTNSSSGNRLEWTTASETDNDYFQLERSIDGNVFSELVWVNGAGNSQQESHYAALDPNPAEVTYYRLKQTDFNGKSIYHPIICVHNSRYDLPPYPNPIAGNGLLHMWIGEKTTDDVLICLKDISGAICLLIHTSGFPETFSLPGLKAGIYFLETTTLTGTKSYRIIVL